MNGNYNIVSCDLPSCTPQNIADGYPTYENVPATNGTIIVWHDSRNGKADIYAKDPLFPPYPIASGPGFQILPAISGNKVVYVDNQVSTSPADVDADNNIYMVDLSKPNEPVSVCDAPGSQWQPHISGTKVVWQDYRNGHWDVYEKDIAENGNGRRLTVNSSGDNIAPDISGDRVVWRNKDGALEDIRWMSLTDEDGAFHIVTDAAVSPNSPRVSGDLVV